MSSILREASLRRDSLNFLAGIFLGGSGSDRRARTTAVILSRLA